MSQRIAIIGAGVSGLSCASELLSRGVTVELFDKNAGLGRDACSWYAGGMLAPWCERENAEEAVLEHGKQAADWWQQHSGGVLQRGTLVVAPPRDSRELQRFSRRTTDFEWQDRGGIDALEPALEGRFSSGLFFAEEAHLDPRLALQTLQERLQKGGSPIHWSRPKTAQELLAQGFDQIIDCRGLNAAEDWPALRGVKGEMLIIRCPELQLQRPVRLLHPRIPLYIVPRDDHHYMVGATMIESMDRRRITARSMLELLGSAYALHPSFGEAEIVEIGVDARPAFADNLPRFRRANKAQPADSEAMAEKRFAIADADTSDTDANKSGAIWMANGLYRHGFLLSPSLATQVANAVLDNDLSGAFYDAG